MVQIAAAIGTILQLLITLGQSEAPPVIVQGPERPDITSSSPTITRGRGPRRRLT